jgi:hypothetical protein
MRLPSRFRVNEVQWNCTTAFFDSSTTGSLMNPGAPNAYPARSIVSVESISPSQAPTNPRLLSLLNVRQPRGSPMHAELQIARAFSPIINCLTAR